jgi:hypothetical protein
MANRLASSAHTHPRAPRADLSTPRGTRPAATTPLERTAAITADHRCPNTPTNRSAAPTDNTEQPK